jgi:hypothetical protein
LVLFAVLGRRDTVDRAEAAVEMAEVAEAGGKGNKLKERRFATAACGYGALVTPSPDPCSIVALQETGPGFDGAVVAGPLCAPARHPGNSANTSKWEKEKSCFPP